VNTRVFLGLPARQTRGTRVHLIAPDSLQINCHVCMMSLSQPLDSLYVLTSKKRNDRG
jgi:hypothetical protein